MTMAARRRYDVLGSDLALTGYAGVPSTVELITADSWGELDLRVKPGGQGGLRQAGDVLDLAVATGRENLGQALLLRILTMKGALAPLGHPQYGSRIPSLVGQLNDEQTRNLARLYTIEAMSDEPRVRELRRLVVEPVNGYPDTIRIEFDVVPLGDEDAINVSLDVTL
jgi:hypothetical protein